MPPVTRSKHAKELASATTNSNSSPRRQQVQEARTHRARTLLVPEHEGVRAAADAPVPSLTFELPHAPRPPLPCLSTSGPLSSDPQMRANCGLDTDSLSSETSTTATEEWNNETRTTSTGVTQNGDITTVMVSASEEGASPNSAALRDLLKAFPTHNWVLKEEGGCVRVGSREIWDVVKMREAGRE